MTAATIIAPATFASSPSALLPTRDIDWYGWWHDDGELVLHVCNLGALGAFGSGDGPSGEWPHASGYEHLYVAGLWVGAKVDGDSLVTTAVYEMEFRPKLEDPIFHIYTGTGYASPGFRFHDDDGDGLIDEERLDGIDDDDDGLIDEDYGGISREMYARTYFDTVDLGEPPPTDAHTPIGIEVHEETFAWSEDDRDDFVGVRYHIANISGAPLDDVFVGLMADPDVGSGAAMNWADDTVAYIDTVATPGLQGHYLPVRVTMVYAQDSPGGDDGDWDGLIGFVLLGHPTDQTGVNAPVSVEPRAVRAWWQPGGDPASDPERYLYLSEPGIHLGNVESQDWRTMLSAGPFNNVQDGETLVVDFALVCGAGMDELLEHAATAATIYNGYYHKRLGRQVRWALINDYIPTWGQSVPGSLLAAEGRSGVESYGTVYLAPPAPNPFQGTCHLGFSIPSRTHVELAVYDAGGRRVATIIDAVLPSGMHEAAWDGRSAGDNKVAAGVYFVRLNAAGEEVASKVIVLR
jgi:hypothetical protein